MSLFFCQVCAKFFVETESKFWAVESTLILSFQTLTETMRGDIREFKFTIDAHRRFELLKKKVID